MNFFLQLEELRKPDPAFSFWDGAITLSLYYGFFQGKLTEFQ